MFNEKYVFVPNMIFDINRIKEIALRNLYRVEPTLAIHQRYVKKEPYLLELQERYPFLSSMYNLYPTPPSFVVPIHICPERGCALNIPIKYTEDSYTVFYEPESELKTRYSKSRVYDIVDSKMIEVYRYTLDRPLIMNTLLPHNVFGGPKDTRVIMSWSIAGSYEETKNLVGML